MIITLSPLPPLKNLFLKENLTLCDILKVFYFEK